MIHAFIPKVLELSLKGFSTAAAERKAAPLLRTSSAASGASGVASGAVVVPPAGVAVAEEPSTSATTRPPPPPGRRLSRSASELSELTEGLAVAGPDDRQSTAKDRPGRLLFGRDRALNKSVPRSQQEPSSQSGVGSSGDDVEAEVDRLPRRKTLPPPPAEEQLDETAAETGAESPPDPPAMHALEA